MIFAAIISTAVPLFSATLYGLQTKRTDDKSYGLLISLGQTVRRQIVRSALIRGGQIVRID